MSQSSEVGSLGVVRFYARLMDREWMRAQLAQYKALAKRYAARRESVHDFDPPDVLAMATDLRQREPTVKVILKRLDASLAEYDFDVMGQPLRCPQCVAGPGDRRRDGRVAEKLAPDAPTLRADQFHPWVWDAARTSWDSEHHCAAVDAAARSISAHTQAKVGRSDISDTDLMNQVFTEKPKSGQGHLRLPGDPNDRTVQNRNRALRPFGEGCYADIRSLAAHEHGSDWTEQRALESLAALSILARWIDECDVRIDP